MRRTAVGGFTPIGTTPAGRGVSPGAGGATAAGLGRGPQPWSISRRLGRADLRAVPATRQALRALLRHWGTPGQSDVAELLAGELVTNALVHTDLDAVLKATVGPRVLRVEVRDFVGLFPRACRPAPDADTHGRGLMLVRSLADAWGVRAHGVGKAVWFELEARAGSPEAAEAA